MTGVPDVVGRLEALPAPRRRAALELLRGRGHEFGVYALSSAQRRLWFLCSLDAELPIYNVPYAFRLTGEVDGDALRDALGEVVRRHEMLRTVFFDFDGEPFYAVLPSIPTPWTVRDLPGELAAALDDQARLPFDLRRGPLLRAGLLTDGEHSHVFLLTLHHLVCDGWSLAIILRELGEAYDALIDGREPHLGPPPARFADAARRQEAAELAGRARLLQYWTGGLAGAPGLLSLPTDHPRPAVESHEGGQEVFHWPVDLREEVERFSAAHRVTPFMTALAAFEVLLYHYTGREDILVGAPVSGRSSLETEDLVGFFVNTVVLRVRPSARMRFAELLAQVREVTLAAQSAQDTPFEVLVETLRTPRNLDHHPLVQVCFVVLEKENELLALPGVTCEQVQGHTGTSKFDLTVSLISVPEGLRGVAEFDSALFEPGTIRRLAADLREVLTAAVAAPERELGSLVPSRTGEEA
ncbi:condensation domain-containing protein [Amycolatopsis sp. H20-H5]|uniref:condensation domain-containing protein n=1 Tax=Amycolatopsis sp. H20-H5 TaxID=3046309 RepID=UPI002DB796A7|nr:condensation domain-containing protein [Amycolatopsis sp. H20-H5]MEC3978260.1 condensation domain-containing protein [Amycolatopsis sp. H20-H5]